MLVSDPALVTRQFSCLRLSLERDALRKQLPAVVIPQIQEDLGIPVGVIGPLK